MNSTAAIAIGSSTAIRTSRCVAVARADCAASTAPFVRALSDASKRFVAAVTLAAGPV
jgi:hypothetical protein